MLRGYQKTRKKTGGSRLSQVVFLRVEMLAGHREAPQLGSLPGNPRSGRRVCGACPATGCLS